MRARIDPAAVPTRPRPGFLDRFFFAPSTPVNLGVVRIALFGSAAYLALAENAHRHALQAALSWRPTSFYRALAAPPSEGVLVTVKVVAVGAAVLAAVGLFTRWSSLVATPAVVFLLGFDSNFGKINHRSMLIALLLIAVVPSRLGDAVSLDRLVAAARRRRYEAAAPSSAYRWPVALAQVTVVSVYFFAGFSKLANGGLDWFRPESFQRFLYIRLDQLASPPAAGLWLASHPRLAQWAAILSVAFELSVALALVRPAFRRAALAGLVAFHQVTKALTRIDFTRTLVAAWIPLVDYEGIGRRMRERVGGRRATVLVDGRCGLCRRSAAVLRTADVLGRLEVLDARDGAMVEARFPHVSADAALEDMHLVEISGATSAGFDAYRRLAAMLPLGWPLLPVLYLPGVPAVGRRLYRRIADSRVPLLHCAGGACEIDHPEAAPAGTGSL